MVEYKEKKNNSRSSFYKIYQNGGHKRIPKEEFLKKVNKSSLKGGSLNGSPLPPGQQWNSPTDPAPPPAHNGGIFPLGPDFTGPWKNYPVTPNAYSFMQNMKSADPPPGWDSQTPGYDRLGNNFQVNKTFDFNNNSTIQCSKGGAYKEKRNKKGGSAEPTTIIQSAPQPNNPLYTNTNGQVPTEQVQKKNNTIAMMAQEPAQMPTQMPSQMPAQMPTQNTAMTPQVPVPPTTSGGNASSNQNIKFITEFGGSKKKSKSKSKSSKKK